MFGTCGPARRRTQMLFVAATDNELRAPVGAVWHVSAYNYIVGGTFGRFLMCEG